MLSVAMKNFLQTSSKESDKIILSKSCKYQCFKIANLAGGVRKGKQQSNLYENSWSIEDSD